MTSETFKGELEKNIRITSEEKEITTTSVIFKGELKKNIRITSKEGEAERGGGEIRIYMNQNAAWITQISPTTKQMILNAPIMLNTDPVLNKDKDLEETIVVITLMDQSSYKVKIQSLDIDFDLLNNIFVL